MSTSSLSGVVAGIDSGEAGMQDLMAVELVPELMQAGVSCFKIEGRLKGPEYVALTTKAYRRAVDIVWDAHLEQQAQRLAQQQELLKQLEQQRLDDEEEQQQSTGVFGPASGTLLSRIQRQNSTPEFNATGSEFRMCRLYLLINVIL